MPRSERDNVFIASTLEEQVVRLQEIEVRLAQLEARLQEPLTQAEKAGVFAHIGSLTQRRKWYLGRIRARKPVQTLGASVGDDIKTAEAGPK